MKTRVSLKYFVSYCGSPRGFRNSFNCNVYFSACHILAHAYNDHKIKANETGLLKNTCSVVYFSTKLQIEGLQLYQKNTPLSIFKGFPRIYNISIFFVISGTSISQNTFQLPLLTVVKVFKIFISTKIIYSGQKTRG